MKNCSIEQEIHYIPCSIKSSSTVSVKYCILGGLFLCLTHCEVGFNGINLEKAFLGEEFNPELTIPILLQGYPFDPTNFKFFFFGGTRQTYQIHRLGTAVGKAVD